MDSDSLIQLLPQLLNKGTEEPVPAGGRTQLGSWSVEQACSDQTSDQTQSDSEQTSQISSDQQDESDDGEQDTEDEGRISPKTVDLDEIEKFLDGITKPHHPSRRAGRPGGRDMATILREVDELGRRTLSSASLSGGGGGGRPPPSPRRPPEPRGRATSAASESALLRDGDVGRRVRFSHQQLAASGDEAATLAPRSGAGGKLSLSEPAIGYAFHGLLSEEKRKYLNLTADMILQKQSSLENEIQMKTQWDEHLRDITAENSSLKLEVERLRSRPPPTLEGQQGERPRLRALEHRLEEQNRLLDGFNAENARLYRELKQLKSERTDLETVIDDLHCDKRLFEARLQAGQRAPRPPQEQGQEQELHRREQELERRWKEVQRAGHEVARLHDQVARRQLSPCGRCRTSDQADSTSRPRTVSAACQTRPQSPVRPSRSPEHVAAAAAAELRSVRAALVQAEGRREEALQTAAAREADTKRACDAKVRTLEGRLRRLQSSSPARVDADLMAALRRLKAQLTEKERMVTQSRRQLEKSQRTVTGLQREREKLLLTIAGRSPERSAGLSRSRRSSPVRDVHGARSQQHSPARDKAHCPVRVDDTLLSELQTAIAAVEEENVLLKDQLGQLTVHRDEEVSRRNGQIAALRKENAEIRTKLTSSGPHPEENTADQEELLSARSDSLMLEVRSQMEAQEEVINHLRETIRRFQEQTRLIAELEQENRTLRETIETLHWQMAAQKRRQSPDTTQVSCIESKLDEIDRQYRRRASYLHAILQQLGHCNLTPRSLDGSSGT